MNQNSNPPSLLKPLCLAFLFMVLAAWFFYLPYRIVRQNIIDSLNAQQLILARQAAHGIEEFFQYQQKLLDHLGQHQGLIHFDQRGQAFIREFQQANSETISAVSRVDRQGRILYTFPYDEAAIGRDVSFQDHNRLIMTNHEPVVSSVFQAIQGYKTVAFAVPVFDGDAYDGSISILIPFEVVAKKFLASITLGNDGYAWLLNRQGIELYCPVPGHVGRTIFETSGRFPTVISMAKEMMAGKEGSTTYRYDRIKDEEKETILKHAVYHPVQLPHNLWSIVVATPEKQVLAPLRDFGRWWLLLFAVFTAVFLGYFSSVVRGRLRFAEQSKRQEAEKKLAESQKLFLRFIRDAHLPIAMVNVVSGAIEFVNEKFVDLYGYTLEDIPTMDDWFARAYPHEATRKTIAERWWRRLDHVRRSTHSGPIEERAVTCKDGTLREVEFAYTLIEDRMVITFNDKTEQLRVEREKKELQQRKAKARKMEALGLLAGGVAHDLNNILSGVVSYPELLLLQLPPDSELRSSIELIQQSGQQAAAVVADLLTVARGVASVKQPANLNTLVTEYLGSPEWQSSAAHNPQISCVTELATDLANISCSAVHIKKCLMNLMTNAAEAIDGPGTITVATRNETISDSTAHRMGLAAGEYVVLSVSDTGSGIPQKDLEHIFEPFYTKKEMGRSGTGLGLAVVWNTMEDHEGSVTVTSSAQGTTFELYLPASAEKAVTQEEEAALDELRGHGEMILVVDDQANQRRIACQIISHLNYTCDSVTSGEEALAYLSNNQVDLVILDMIMGSGMDGCQTYEAMIARNPHQKAIIASGYSENDNVKRAQRLGAGDFIKKPYSLGQLGLAIKKALTPEVDRL